MNPSYDFTGQVALVTGASSGMGLATARAFAEAGAAVVLADINQAALTAVTDELTAAGHQVLGVPCDVADEDQVAALVATTVDTFGRLDMAFNNAGIQLPVCDAADEPAEAFDRVTAINLRGVWACMKHELEADAYPGQRRDRQLLLPRRTGRQPRPGRLPRHQARRPRSDQQRRPRVRTPRDPDQRRLPRHHRHPDGHRHARHRRARPRSRRWRTSPSTGSANPRRSPPPCCGCAAPAPASSSASPSPSTAATPPASPAR